MNQPEPAYRDNCLKCLDGPYEPLVTRAEDHDLVGDYTCTECGHTWRCWWNTSALPSDDASAGDVA